MKVPAKTAVKALAALPFVTAFFLAVEFRLLNAVFGLGDGAVFLTILTGIAFALTVVGLLGTGTIDIAKDPE